jgi:hypothetical protein
MGKTDQQIANLKPLVEELDIQFGTQNIIENWVERKFFERSPGKAPALFLFHISPMFDCFFSYLLPTLCSLISLVGSGSAARILSYFTQ